IVISSELTTVEEEDLLKEAKMVYDSLEGDLNDMIPIYCSHTHKMNKGLNPVVQPQEVLTPTLEDLVKKEVMKLFETGLINRLFDSLRVSPVDVTPKTKEPKKTPRRSIKGKRFKWKVKKKKPKSDQEDMCSWLVDRAKQGEIELRRVGVQIFLLIIWRSGICASRRGPGALRRSVDKQQISFLKSARRAG
ncbi:hypothetical protein A2U01_0030080, partial [Trifolium medium]|nr:hypothetical protein [Trifolium medium]